MRTRRLFTIELPDAVHALWVAPDTFVVATLTNVSAPSAFNYRSSLIWYRLTSSGIDVVHQLEYDGRIMGLFLLPQLSAIGIHFEAVLNRQYVIQLSDIQMVHRGSLSTHHSWIYQLSCAAACSSIAAFGQRIPGYPIDSSLIEISSGVVRRLSYSACAIHNNAFYFLDAGYLRQTSLPKSLLVNEDESALLCEYPVSEEIISILPGDGSTTLLSGNAILCANKDSLVVKYTWEQRVAHVLKCGSVYFARAVGPAVYVWHDRTNQSSDIASSSQRQVHGFDVIEVYRGTRICEGKLVVVSGPGVIDVHSWIT